jgi:hypothetical protein
VYDYDCNCLRFDGGRRFDIMSRRALHPGITNVPPVLVAAMLVGVLAAQTKSATVRVGASDLGGVVSSSHGAEAGVWVIAQTTDLPTKFVKIVVTDDMGRYLVPELPKANYRAVALALRG